MIDEYIASSDFEAEEKMLLALAVNPARKQDANLRVRFYPFAELNSFQSKVEGHKVFVNKTYIEIITPANLRNIIIREASDDDKLRFSVQYERFLKDAHSQISDGTPIEELPTITKAQQMELRALKVDTIEQLAGAADSTVQILGMGMDLKKRAQAFVAKISDATEQGNRIRTLEAQLKELMAERAKPQATAAQLVTTTALPVAQVK